MFSQTAEYALRAMNCLAAASGHPATGETIAGRTKVPPGYLSKVMRDLVVAGLVVSRRGPTGGFLLARDASAISILDVVDAVDPLRRIERCPLGNPEHARLCPLHASLDGAIAQIRETLGATSLADLGASGRVARACAAMSGAKPARRGAKAD